MELNNKNYFGNEAMKEYWSASQVKSFLSCTAKAMAELNGEFKPEIGTALLVGSFVDTYFEGEEQHQEFMKEHPELFKRDGQLKADYVQAIEMINRAEKDQVFMEYMTGEKQRIFTGDIDGIPFKAKFDVYLPGKRIVDLKTVKDMKPLYREGEGRLDPIEYWRWPLQMAIYQHLEGNHLPCYLAIITKEDPANLFLFQIDQAVMDAEMEFLRQKLPKLDAIKQGLIEPERCEDCAYCRQSKILTAPMNYTGGMEKDE